MHLHDHYLHTPVRAWGPGSRMSVNCLGPFLTPAAAGSEIAGRASRANSVRKRPPVVATKSSGQAEGPCRRVC